MHPGLLLDPFSVSRGERSECLLGGGGIDELSQSLHAELDAGDRSRCDPLDLGRGDPARADASTVTLLVDISVGCNAVPDGVLANVPILQVCDALIGIDAGGISLFSGQSADIRAGYEGFRRPHLQAGLEDKPGVADFVGLKWIAAINKEHRDRPTAWGDQGLRTTFSGLTHHFFLRF